MAEAMDGRDAAGLRASRRRQAREDEILEWWARFRAKPQRSTRGLQVRDKSDGSNRYGVIPWDVPLRDQGAPSVGQLEEPEAVHNGRSFGQFPSRRRRDPRRRGNRQGQGPVV